MVRPTAGIRKGGRVAEWTSAPSNGNGADVAEVMRRPVIRLLSWLATALGCRVVVEAGLQALERTAAVILVEGSQFAPSMETSLMETFAAPEGF